MVTSTIKNGTLFLKPENGQLNIDNLNLRVHVEASAVGVEQLWYSHRLNYVAMELIEIALASPDFQVYLPEIRTRPWLDQQEHLRQYEKNVRRRNRDRLAIRCMCLQRLPRYFVYSLIAAFLRPDDDV